MAKKTVSLKKRKTAKAKAVEAEEAEEAEAGAGSADEEVPTASDLSKKVADVKT